MKKSFIVLMLVFLIPQCLIAQKTATLIYIDQYKAIAIKEMKRTGIPASITLAQGIIESNSGQSNLSLNFKNHFGIKCKSDWQGETTYQDDDTNQECFRVYPTAARSFIDHSDFLKSRPNYAPLFELDPVDDSAWAYGLKKAGYATAPDYPRKLLKVINDFELSQYNFPELALEDSIEANNKVGVVVGIGVDTILSLKKDTTPPAATMNLLDINWNKPLIESKKDNFIKGKMDSLVVNKDTAVSLSNVKGLSVTVATNNSLPTAIQSIEIVKDKAKKDTIALKDTLNKVISKTTYNYPDEKFRINDIPVVWAKAGSSYLAIANNQMVPFYRLFEFNEIAENDIVTTDQLVFLAPKKKGTPKKVHTIKTNETLYGISQSEGIQLKYLKQFNPKANDDNLKEGDFLFLFRPFDAPKNNHVLLEALQPVSNSTNKKVIKDTMSELKNKPATKDKIDFIKKIKSLIKKKN